MTLNDLLGYFPPHLDGSLISLMEDTIPPQLNSREVAAVRWRREMSLQRVHRHFETDEHAAAIEVLKAAWREKGNFGVYLRNFKLGAHAEKFENFAATRVSMTDARFQLFLSKTFSSSLPIVAISNPAFDFSGDDYLPKLRLNDHSWSDVLIQLVAAAKLVVLLYDSPTQGVDFEVNAICELSRQKSTVVVFPEGAAEANQAGLQRKGFCQFIELQHIAPLANIVSELLREDLGNDQRSFSEPLAILQRSGVPEHLRIEAMKVAQVAFQEALEHANRSEFFEFENAAIRALVLCCFAGYDEGRAAVQIQLANYQRYVLGEFERAQASYERGIAVCERLQHFSAEAAHILDVARRDWLANPV